PDVEIMPSGIEVGHDRIVFPVPVPVDDIAPVALAQQLGIEVLFHRPGAGPRTDPNLRFSVVGHFSSRESSADFASSPSSESASSVSSDSPEATPLFFAEPFAEAPAPTFCARLLIFTVLPPRPPPASTERT